MHYIFSNQEFERQERNPKMKYLVAIFLFASFIAGLRADDLDGFLLDDEADGVDPTKHPYIVSISLYSHL